MIHELKIRGYRAFERLTLSELGQINLVVGTNNSGKTSVLEALYLLVSGGDPAAMWRVVNRRGERLDEATGRQPEPEADVSHLFHGHELIPGASIELAAGDRRAPRVISYTVRVAGRDEELSLPPSARDEPIGPRLTISVEGTPKPLLGRIPLSRRGGLSFDTVERRRIRPEREGVARPAQYVTTESLSGDDLAGMWNRIVLTDSEARVLKALRFLDPNIERIAAVSQSRYSYYNSIFPRGGFLVRMKGVDQPIPIGSLGDGTWRMLALVISIIQAKDGLLLVDEIDTGFHYTVMSDMWRLIAEASKAFNVQVFATSHSYDCVQSLAELCGEDDDAHDMVSIQRIEPSRDFSVPYTQRQIKMAAQRHIEMR